MYTEFVSIDIRYLCTTYENRMTYMSLKLHKTSFGLHMDNNLPCHQWRRRWRHDNPLALQWLIIQLTADLVSYNVCLYYNRYIKCYAMPFLLIFFITNLVLYYVCIMCTCSFFSTPALLMLHIYHICIFRGNCCYRQHFAHDIMEDIMTCPITDPLWGESTDHRRIPLKKLCFHVMFSCCIPNKLLKNSRVSGDFRRMTFIRHHCKG